MSHTWNVHLYIAALTRRFATNTQHDRLWSAAPATQNEATRHLKPPKVTTFVNSPEARPYYPRDDCSQTVANGCRHLRTQKQRRANTSQPPDPQSKTRTFRYAFGEKKNSVGSLISAGKNLRVSTAGSATPQSRTASALQHDSMSWSWESYQTCWRNQLMNDQPFCLANRCSPVLVSPHVWRLQVRANELKAFWGITNFKQVILYTHCYWSKSKRQTTPLAREHLNPDSRGDSLLNDFLVETSIVSESTNKNWVWPNHVKISIVLCWDCMIICCYLIKYNII